jgi:hypothetical protein
LRENGCDREKQSGWSEERLKVSAHNVFKRINLILLYPERKDRKGRAAAGVLQGGGGDATVIPIESRRA